MAKLVWDAVGEHFYETGVDHGIVFPVESNGTMPKGFAWNGLTNVSETPSGAESTEIYADNIKYLDILSAEKFACTIEALYYPKEFAVLDGTASPTEGVNIGQQARGAFGFAYRSLLGNDVKGNDFGYKLHLIYNLKASPSEKAYSTVNDSPEAITFSWECNSTPVNVTGYKATSLLTIDSTKVDPAKLASFLEILEGSSGSVSYNAFSGSSFTPGETYYEQSGSEYVATTDTEPDGSKTYYTKTETGGTDARMPLPDEVIAHFGNGASG